MDSPATCHAARNAAAGRRAAIGWKIGSLAAALVLAASAPSDAGVWFSASGVVDNCQNGQCLVQVDIPLAGHPGGIPSNPGSQNSTLSFSSPSTILSDVNNLWAGYYDNSYTAGGSYISGSDSGGPVAGATQVLGLTSIMNFTEFMHATSPPCPFQSVFPGCTDAREDFQYAWDVEAVVDASGAGKTWYLSISSVPEPSAWVLLIAGLAILGASIRTRTGQVRRTAPRL